MHCYDYHVLGKAYPGDYEELWKLLEEPMPPRDCASPRPSKFAPSPFRSHLEKTSWWQLEVLKRHTILRPR